MMRSSLLDDPSWMIQEKGEDLTLTCCSKDVAASARLVQKVLSLCRMIRHVSELNVHQQTFAGSFTVRCKTTPEGLNL